MSSTATISRPTRIGLGCTTFGREIPEATAFSLMDYAVAHGITLFDTAEAYGGGQARDTRRRMLGVDDTREVSHELHSSEKIIGRWLQARGCRDRITLVTKEAMQINLNICDNGAGWLNGSYGGGPASKISSSLCDAG